jgi:phosphoribosylaminoimidazole-succinocarboxamide synthase
MIANSTLMKSYEAIMQQYEQELEKKTKTIAELQIEQSQIVEENTNLGHQLYVLKTKFNSGDGAILGSAEEDKIERIQKDQMVALLKRNHDTLLEKYELFRKRNESLERLAVEKETMYNDVKIEFDK